MGQHREPRPHQHHRDPLTHGAALSTSHALAMARDDIHTAVNADDEHRRLQYALAARDNAAEVLTDPHATRAEIDYASHYFADAEALIAQLADPDA